MSTGLFSLLRSVKDLDLTQYLNGLPYDELIEFDLDGDCFSSLFHTAKKYSLSLTSGTVRELTMHMSEILVHPEDRERFAGFIDPDTLDGRLDNAEVSGFVSAEFRLRLLGGGWNWAELVLLRVNCPDSMPYRLYFFDIQSRKCREMGLSVAYSASAENRNEMTGLLKKTAFIAGAEEIVSSGGDDWCFIAIDIENFKLLNEWYGHSRGDFIMVQIGATLLKEKKEHGGLAGYFGQDDFCLLIPYDEARVQSIYDEISFIISDSCSTGSFMPAFGVSFNDDITNVRELLDMAFLAVRFAKESYHSRIRLFESSMYKKTNNEYRIISEFLSAMKNNEITFNLQPQCLTSDGRIVGAEALARWIKPDGSRVPPNVFIPVLEKHGLITDLDEYIWNEVCAWIRSMLDRGRTPLPISLNVSPLDIVNLDLADHFEKLVNRYDLSRGYLKIEITESAYISNSTLVADTVQRLRDKGFTVMMDDFGSGFSSLNMLRTMNIDVIKLDAQFLRLDKNNEIKGIHIIESVVNMAKTIGIPIIVEGVENEEQKRFLEDLGCSYIQGFYYFRPMSVENYEELTSDPGHVDTTGLRFKANQQFRIKELLDDNVYSDAMLNNILGACAFYSRHGDSVDIVRYNEQFHRTVGVSDIADRVTAIEQYLPENDAGLMLRLLDIAEQDRLNGSKGVLRFYKPDGTLTSFFMRFYYLHSDRGAGERTKLYYGSAQDITKLTTLETQMMLLRRFSPYTVVFMQDGDRPTFSVLFNGLEHDLELDSAQLEDILNGMNLYDHVCPMNKERLGSELPAKIANKESFVTEIKFITGSGDPLDLILYCDHVGDSTGNVDYIITMRKTDAEVV